MRNRFSKAAVLLLGALLLPGIALAGPEVGRDDRAVGSADPSKNQRGHTMSSKDGETRKHWGPGGTAGPGGKKDRQTSSGGGPQGRNS